VTGVDLFAYKTIQIKAAYSWQRCEEASHCSGLVQDNLHRDRGRSKTME
jgi:hypothetical protein